MAKSDWIWGVALAGGAAIFFWKDICTALKLPNVQCPTTWISDSLMNMFKAQGQTGGGGGGGTSTGGGGGGTGTTTSPYAGDVYTSTPVTQTKPSTPSYSYNPIAGGYVTPNPGGTAKSCAGMTGFTCVACCQAKGLTTNCDCSQARYARAYRVKHMRNFNKMRKRTAYTSYQATGRFGLRKLPTVYG